MSWLASYRIQIYTQRAVKNKTASKLRKSQRSDIQLKFIFPWWPYTPNVIITVHNLVRNLHSRRSSCHGEEGMEKVEIPFRALFNVR